MHQQLQSLLENADISVSDQQLNQLVSYVQLLDKWNKAYNLTSVRNPIEMLSKHIVDSVVVSKHLNGKRFIDVGTGPGLPGIPLAIVNPDKQFSLLDSLGKRIRFLKEVQRQLQLDNIDPIQSRVEAYRPENLYDGVISRAFASLEDMISYSEHLLTSNGLFYALKGIHPDKEIAALPDSVKVADSFSLNVPGVEGERHLICISKISPD